MSAGNPNFKNGWEGGPGRPKGSVSGRAQCLAVLDALLKEAGNQEALRKKLQEYFDNDPAKFMLKYVYPVVPKDVLLKTGDDESSVDIRVIIGHGND
uniref:Uncharacterized protein n=1 Tax=viral metagenome TaxID=1070528 RepID=A0A6M3LAB4_9ZZZZ